MGLERRLCAIDASEHECYQNRHRGWHCARSQYGKVQGGVNWIQFLFLLLAAVTRRTSGLTSPRLYSQCALKRALNQTDDNYELKRVPVNE